MLGLAHGGAAAQGQNGRLKGFVDQHRFDIAVSCSIEQMGKTRIITAHTDGSERRPMEDTNGDGIAGQISGMGDRVAVELKFGEALYKFSGSKSVEFRDGGFSWKGSMADYDNEKMRQHLATGKRLKDLAPEREYDIELDFSCQ